MITMMGINLSVGTGGFNFYQDTVIVQELLNEHLMGNGRFRAALDKQLTMIGQILTVDGDCGPLTEGAIRAFQISVMRKSPTWADGRVDPGGKTWKALNGTVEICDVPSMALTPNLQGAVGASLGQVMNYQMFRQGQFTAELGHRYDSNQDGVTNEHDAFATIKSQGCCLCTLTMAATVIGKRVQPYWPTGVTPANLTPHEANIICHKGGAQGPGGLDMPKACELLGMRGTHYGYGSASIPADSVNIIRSHLAGGNPVAVHVDYRDRFRRGQRIIHTAGDHWVLIVATQGGVRQFTAIDPASGTKMWFTSNNTLNLRAQELAAQEMLQDMGGGGTTTFRPGALYGIASSPGTTSEEQRDKQNKYVVVRFMTLFPA